MSGRWKKKYFIDLTQYWIHRDSNFYFAVFLILTTYLVRIIVLVGKGISSFGLCFTCDINDDEVYALTACPTPPDDISDMMRVGDKFA